MMRLTDNQLFAYLDGGEDDPFVAEMLSRDSDAQARLALIRRVRTQLGSVAQPAPLGAYSMTDLHASPVRNISGATRSALREPAADRPENESGALAAFLQGKAERHDLGEIRIPLPSDAGADPQVLAELRAGRYVVEVALFRAGEASVLRVRIRERDEGPVDGVRANLLSPGEAVQRFSTDAEGVFDLPVPGGPALLRLEMDPTCEIRLIASTDL